MFQTNTYIKTRTLDCNTTQKISKKLRKTKLYQFQNISLQL